MLTIKRVERETIAMSEMTDGQWAVVVGGKFNGNLVLRSEEEFVNYDTNCCSWHHTIDAFISVRPIPPERVAEAMVILRGPVEVVVEADQMKEGDTGTVVGVGDDLCDAGLIGAVVRKAGNVLVVIVPPPSDQGKGGRWGANYRVRLEPVTVIVGEAS
jgi:hypothetical protein